MNVVYAERARRDIGEIYDAIAIRNSTAAQRVEDMIRSNCEGLADFPFASAATDELNVRRLPLVRYPYTIFLPPRGRLAHVPQLVARPSQCPLAEVQRPRPCANPLIDQWECQRHFSALQQPAAGARHSDVCGFTADNVNHVVRRKRSSPGRAETRASAQAGLGHAASVCRVVVRGPRPFGEGPLKGLSISVKFEISIA